MSISSNTTSASALGIRLGPVSSSSSMVSVSSNWSSAMPLTSISIPIRPPKSSVIRCEVANAVEESSLSTSSDKIGARVKVKVPVKVYHVPKVPELDLTGMEGEIKEYVALWNGKRISANLPYKIRFVTDIQGRGPVKFFAHLKEEEFDYV